MLRNYDSRTAGPGCGELGNRPKWRHRTQGILSELAERKYEQRNLHGYEPLRIRWKREDDMWRKRWAWKLNHRGWRRLGALHVNYGGWSPVSAPITRLFGRDFENRRMWGIVWLNCRRGRRRGAKSKFDYNAECDPPWRPWSTTWVRVLEMRKFNVGKRGAP